MELDKAKLNKFEETGRNPFNAPIPGESLTQNPDQKFPWEQPPEINDVDTAIKEVFINLTERDTLIELLNILNAIKLCLFNKESIILFKNNKKRKS